MALLDLDPDLGRSIPEERWAAARDQLVAPRLKIPRGPMPAMASPPRPSLGYLITSGLVMREVTVAGRPSCELLGPGDIIRPWGRDAVELLPRTISWHAAEASTFADLTGAVGQRLSAWPEVVEALVDRSIGRAQSMGVQRSITSHVRVDVRVLAFLWHLAERWGVVLPGAIRIACPLTHATLARMVGARRPTVTTALQRLMRLGHVRRDGTAFVVVGDGSAVADLEQHSPSRERLAVNGNAPATAA